MVMADPLDLSHGKKIISLNSPVPLKSSNKYAHFLTNVPVPVGTRSSGRSLLALLTLCPPLLSSARNSLTCQSPLLGPWGSVDALGFLVLGAQFAGVVSLLLGQGRSSVAWWLVSPSVLVDKVAVTVLDGHMRLFLFHADVG